MSSEMSTEVLWQGCGGGTKWVSRLRPQVDLRRRSPQEAWNGEMRMLIGAKIRFPGIETTRPMEGKKRLPVVARSLFSGVESTGAVNNGVPIIAKLIKPSASTPRRVMLSTSNQ